MKRWFIAALVVTVAIVALVAPVAGASWWDGP